eukprot:5626795-Pyramimonas_sp.AAC.1
MEPDPGQNTRRGVTVPRIGQAPQNCTLKVMRKSIRGWDQRGLTATKFTSLYSARRVEPGRC